VLEDSDIGKTLFSRRPDSEGCEAEGTGQTATTGGEIGLAALQIRQVQTIGERLHAARVGQIVQNIFP
jgi:hypothetical protein